MSSDKVVLVVGTGNVAQVVVAGLLKANLKVRVLARAGKEVPWVTSAVEVVRGDLHDRASLDAACQGAFTVISTVADAAGPEVLLTGQLNLVDAAEKAGVRQFIPSDFGLKFSRTTLPGALFQWKEDVLQDLVKRSEKNPSFAYTVVCNGCFFEFWCLPFLCVNFPAGTAEIFGDGEAQTSFLTLGDLGNFVAASIGREDLYNKVVEVSSFNTTWNAVIAELNTHLDAPLTVTHTPTAALEAAFPVTENIAWKSFIAIKASIANGFPIDDAAVAKTFPTVTQSDLKTIAKTVAEASKKK